MTGTLKAIHDEDSSAPNNQTLHKLDYLIGLRAWGLIVYGVLPANLALLGFIKIDLAGSQSQKMFPWLLLSLLTASFLPLFITFLLIRNRHREWYLTYDCLNIRSALTTFIILIGAALIFGASGIIRGEYVITLTGNYYVGVVQSLLFGIASLVLSSTLFINILTKGGDLPGLPSTSVVNLITTIRGKLRQIQAKSIWRDFDPITDIVMLESAKKTAQEVKDALGATTAHSGHALTKLSLEPVQIGIKHFITAIEYILAPGASDALRRQRWEVYFAREEDLNENRRIERRRKESEYQAIQEIRKLRLGGLDG